MHDKDKSDLLFPSVLGCIMRFSIKVDVIRLSLPWLLILEIVLANYGEEIISRLMSFIFDNAKMYLLIKTNDTL